MSAVAEARASLARIAGLPDEAIDLGEAALALASLDAPSAALAPYHEHLAALADMLGAIAAAADSLESRRCALADVLYGSFGYRGDTQSYDDLQNASLIRVIDRRMGLPVTLGILYIHTARRVGWAARGLAFPGHFLVRLEGAGERLIVDPFADGETRSPAELRDLLKAAAGLDAELRPDHYAPVTNRAVLVRLQNNLKVRQIEAGRIEAALAVIERTLLFAPDEAPLWRESGLINARLGRYAAAAAALERYLEGGRSSEARREAAALLQQVRRRLN